MFRFFFTATVLLIFLTPSPASGQRFVDNGDGTIKDNKTGLIWQKRNSQEKLTFKKAVAYCNSLSDNKLQPWRVPTANEIRTIFDNNSYSKKWPTEFEGARNSYWIDYQDGPSDGIGVLSVYRNAQIENGREWPPVLARCVKGSLSPKFKEAKSIYKRHKYVSVRATPS